MSHVGLAEHSARVRALLEAGIAAAAAGSCEPEYLSVFDSRVLNRLLAEDMVAASPVPAFDNSQMDGYALRGEDLENASQDSPVTLAIGHTIAAGDAPSTHAPGSASPIMTGAPIPLGADAVVPIEHADPPAFPVLRRAGAAHTAQERASGRDQISTVSFAAPVRAGAFIRREGEDLSLGACVATAGTRVTPPLIGALASAGHQQIAVRPRPRILLVATGDEIASGESLAPGQIHDANTPLLRAFLESLGGDVTILRTSDAAEELRVAVDERLAEADIVVTTGGVSKGAFEVVKDTFAPLGIEFHSVAIQPGGPQGLGQLRDKHGRDVPILCFPGNPVSAYLSCELFLAPALREIAGHDPLRPISYLALAEDLEAPEHLHQLRRGMLDERGHAVPLAPGSHLIGELAAADLIIHVPVGVSHFRAGQIVETWNLRATHVRAGIGLA